jgi:hypothetical protein
MSDIDPTEYEQLVRGIYQALHDADGLVTVDVRHNAKLQGRSGAKHQIDVYWEFEKAGERHRVAVECKHYRNKVGIGEVRNFFGALADIGGLKGIFVTTVGYTKGAAAFAEEHDITLKEVRAPTPGDWQGRVRDVVTDIIGSSVRVTKCNVNLDNGWLVEHGKTKEGEVLLLSLAVDNDKMFVFDGDGRATKSFLDLVQRLPRDFLEERQRIHRYDFTDGYLMVPDIGKVKVNFVEFTYDVLLTTVTAVTAGEEIGRAIIKDVKTGAIRLYDRDGGVR